MLSEKEGQRRHKLIKEGMERLGVSVILIAGNTSRRGHIQYVSGYSISFDGAYIIFPIKGEPTIYLFSRIQEERTADKAPTSGPIS